MKLLTLKTKNFKRLRDFACSFTDGLNTIIGDNAAGKTTLLQAVITAFYGPSSVPGKVDDLPTWGQKSFEVALEFEHEGQVYLATRDARNANILRGTELVASGNTNCTKFVEELLGISFKDFLLFVLSQQGETAGVLTYGATALQKRVEVFSGADLLDKVLAKVRSEMSVLSRNLQDVSLSELEKALANHLTKKTTLQGQVDAETALLESASEAYDKNNKTLAESRLLLKELIQALHLLESREQAANHTQAQWDSSKEAVMQAWNTKKQLPEQIEVEELEAEFTPLMAEIKSTAAKIKTLKGYSRDYETLCEKLKRLRGEQVDVEAAIAKVTELNTELTPLMKAKEGLQVEVLEHKSTLRNLKSQMEDGVCGSCNRPFEDHDPERIEALISEAQAELNRKSGALDTLQAKINPVVKALSQAERAASSNVEEQLEVVQSKVAEYESIADSFSEDAITALEQSQVDNRVRVEQLQAEIEQAEGLAARHRRADAQVEKATSRMSDAEDKHTEALALLKEAEAAIAKANPDGRDATEVRMEYELLIKDAESQVLDLSKQVRAHEGVISDLNSELASTEKDINLVTRELRKVIGVAELLDTHKRLAKFLTESRTTYLKQVWDQILGVASAKVAISTNGRINRLHRDEKGDFVAEEEGKWVPIANCSGAQKAHIGVAMRVGLSASLYGATGLLILDEPTDAMNDTNALNLAGSLMGLGGQCLMITHRSYEQLAAQNIITVQ